MSEHNDASGGHFVSGHRLVTEGEWEGWSYWAGDSFEELAGPFYERTQADGSRISAFVAQAKHMNASGVMHGGLLTTFADSALFTIASAALDGGRGVTLSLTTDFLDAVRIGERVESEGQVTRSGRSIVFVKGTARADGRTVLSFTGIIKRVGRR